VSRKSCALGGSSLFIGRVAKYIALYPAEVAVVAIILLYCTMFFMLRKIFTLGEVYEELMILLRGPGGAEFPRVDDDGLGGCADSERGSRLIQNATLQDGMS
jgi:hypothetical protein